MCEEKFIRLNKNFDDLKKEHEILLASSKETDTQRDITVVTFLYRIRYQNYTLSKLNVYYIFEYFMFLSYSMHKNTYFM